MQMPCRWHSIAILLMIAACWPVAGMELDRAQTLALERDPALAALKQRVSASEDLAIAASALPDPELFLGAEGVPVDDPLTADMMTEYSLGLRQRIPVGASRSARERAGFSQAEELEARYRARRLEVLRETRKAWIDWVSALAAADLARPSRSTFEDLVSVAEARYRSGSGGQNDVSRANLELALLAQRILARVASVEDAGARLQRWTSEAPNSSLQLELPDLPRPDTLDRLEQQLAHHPELLALQARQAAGEAGVDEARAAFSPEWMIEAGYGHLRGSDPMSGQRQTDQLFAMVSFSLPLFTANRQDRRLSAARAESTARSLDLAERRRELRGELDRQTRLWEQYERRLSNLREHVLGAAENTLETTLLAYRTDRADFDEVVRARLALFEQQQSLIELRRAQARTRAELNYLAGGNSP